MKRTDRLVTSTVNGLLLILQYNAGQVAPAGVAPLPYSSVARIVLAQTEPHEARFEPEPLSQRQVVLQ